MKLKNIILTCLATCLSAVAMAQDYSLSVQATTSKEDKTQAVLDVRMTNKETVSAIQFDVCFSENADVFYGKNADGDMAYLISKGERAKTNHAVSFRKIADRTYRVIVSSPKNDTFKETDANKDKPIVTIIIDVKNVINNTVVKTDIKNIVLSHYDTSIGNVEMYYPEDVSYEFTLQRTIKGDVNGDGVVNQEDVRLVCDYYLGVTNAINTETADLNGDGKITMADANEIVNMYLVK